jgi:hypothetical protein
VTSRLLTADEVAPSPDWDRYATLLQDAYTAFQQDVMYAVQVVESARSYSTKKVIKRSKT